MANGGGYSDDCPSSESDTSADKWTNVVNEISLNPSSDRDSADGDADYCSIRRGVERTAHLVRSVSAYGDREMASKATCQITQTGGMSYTPSPPSSIPPSFFLLARVLFLRVAHLR